MPSYLYNHRFSIQIVDQENNDKTVLQHLSAACIAQWVQQKPNAKATMTLDNGDTVNLPVYALRRRNAVVAQLPDAPSITFIIDI
ncbi:uncharacterized protein BX663DRAFT_553282 [Cokeromyces recurvatus]|uniref:uncharacterized protein n=1 Tax=Cokeromyces recurvatus TaxID=90255 RepID=UPI002220A6F3|nr:uncharacterized protein BX663DRAFT_553282 [Cokeromyces recurvatus]KAI7901493.1 hypothetical protein BX663DRAFT_553282 [Cokeromyces recurvatus]